jgi:hypothetical protein
LGPPIVESLLASHVLVYSTYKSIQVHNRKYEKGDLTLELEGELRELSLIATDRGVFIQILHGMIMGLMSDKRGCVT